MRKLSRYMKPFLIPIILVVILVFLEVLTELKLPDLMSEIVDQGIVRGDIGFIWKTGGLMLLVAFGGLLCAILGNYLGAKASTGFGRDLRNALFSHVEEFSLEEFNKFGTASLITRTTNDIQQVQGVFLMILRMVIRAPMMAVGGVLMALRKDAQLAWMLVGVLPLVAAVIAIVAVKGVPLFKILQKKLDSLNRVLREQLMGVRVIRAFDRGDFEEERFREANQDLTSTALRVNRIMAVLMPLMSLLLNLTTITIIWFGSHRIDAGYMQVGDMMAFLQYAIQILMSLVMFSMIFVMLPRASASAERINDVLNTVPAIRDPEQPIIPERNEGVVQFENVTFSYPGAEAPVLHDISFTAKPGEVTAVIGGTGSGKSTLLDLIPRFYDVNEGRITLDGVDIRDMTQEELRSRIGYIPQKAVLFSGTISQNIRRGKQTATEEEVKRAAQVAQAADFIKERED
ncbi:MAG: ATP-binding cassette domain-containing protein, partial [Firmicutes bacterium]|nr:ATP-binding cassette domain-containing protein [Bacillota bacterium]